MLGAMTNYSHLLIQQSHLLYLLKTIPPKKLLALVCDGSLVTLTGEVLRSLKVKPILGC